MTLNLSQVFVRYPDPSGAATAVRAMLAPRARAGGELPRHVVVSTGTPWLAVLAGGNSAPHELAEYLSRVLEAHAVWFGLAGRALAWRLRRYHLGRRTEELLRPPELFDRPDPFPLPAYDDAEAGLAAELKKDQLPHPYLYLFVEELGVRSADGDAIDAIAIASAPWNDQGLDEHGFVHRLPRRAETRFPRTMFDRFDDEKEVVADEVVLRGEPDPDRIEALLDLLQRMANRRAVPVGWKYVYLLRDSAGPALLKAVGEAFARRRAAGRTTYEIAIE